MGKRKAELKLTGFKELMEKYESIENGILEPAISKGLCDVQDYLNERLDKTLINAKLPAGGKYSKGGVKKSIVSDHQITKDKDYLSIKLGFKLDAEGFPSLMLMYGTPRMKPAKGLHACFNGAKSRREAGEIFERTVSEEIAKIMNN